MDSSFDRRLGHAVRTAVHALPGGAVAARAAADALAPAFEGLLVAMVTRPEMRRDGLRAGAAAVLAATSARVARDTIGRPRPGERSDGGLPSRHAAAAVAIACAVTRRHRRLGGALAVAAGVGLLGRVVTGDHDPADIAAGAVLGASVDWLVAHIAGDVA
jgi:membrane-associated phospholipid phosphatase